jgi:hypothetical protein
MGPDAGSASGSSRWRSWLCRAVGRTLRLKTSKPAGSRGLPDSAAPVAGNDPAPPTCARIADEPAAPARPRGANRYCDGNAAAAADATRNLAAAGRRNAMSRYGEGDTVGRAAITRRGGKGHTPDTVIGTRPDGPGPPGGVGGTGRGHRGYNRGSEYPAQGAHVAWIGKNGDRSS